MEFNSIFNDVNNNLEFLNIYNKKDDWDLFLLENLAPVIENANDEMKIIYINVLNTLSSSSRKNDIEWNKKEVFRNIF